jgi:transposase
MDVLQLDVEDEEEVLARVAAIDVAKATGMVCARVPHENSPGRRVTKVWQGGWLGRELAR